MAILNINYIPDVSWVQPIANAVIEFDKRNGNEKSSWSSKTIGPRSIAITSKLKFLNLCIERLSGELISLTDELSADRSNVIEHLVKGYAYGLKDFDFPYYLALDFEQFIMISRSAYEIMGKFIHLLFKEIIKKQITEKELKEILTRNGAEISWIDELGDSRKYFFHDHAAWIGLDIENEKVEFYNLCLVDNNNKIVFDYWGYHRICRGFIETLSILQKFLINEINNA